MKIIPIERHPFSPFIPTNAKYLLLGSFPGKNSTQNPSCQDWYYGGKRNQFWIILESIYNRPLSNKLEKQSLFYNLNMAITDIILSCKRKNNNNLDSNLTDKKYNIQTIKKIIQENPIKKIYFTGKGVYHEFTVKIQKKLYLDKNQNIIFTPLPSPSPAYTLNILEKIALYKKLLK